MTINNYQIILIRVATCKYLINILIIKNIIKLEIVYIIIYFKKDKGKFNISFFKNQKCIS